MDASKFYWIPHRINKYGSKEYASWLCAAMNRVDSRVHDDKHCCEWVSPYGFVPEAGCPLHD